MTTRWTGRMILLAGLLGAFPLMAPADDGSARPARGPVVVIPDCAIVSAGCDLDPDTPVLNAAACAADVARLLQRRGVSSTLPGPVADVCAVDPKAVAVLTTITAVCLVEKGRRTPQEFALHTRLEAAIEVKDCAGAETAGRGRAGRAVEAGRRTLLRDAVEELGHRFSTRRVRRSHPGTPHAWLRADVGGEYGVEVRGGVVEIGGSGINDFFKAAGLPADETATRSTIELAYHPWRSQRARFAVALDAMQIHASGKGTFNGSLLHLGSGVSFSSARVDATLRALGPVFSASYGLDYTRHQRISLGGSLGYYVLGTWLAPSEIEIEGTDPRSFKLSDSNWGIGAEARWDWRVTAHFGVSASWGWNRLNFDRPRRTITDKFLPYDVDFTGRTARLGIAARF